MSALLVIGLQLLGLAALALTMDRHHEQLLRCMPDPGGRAMQHTRRSMRVLGVALLAASLCWAALSQGLTCGSLLWLGLLSPASLVVTAVIARASVNRSR